MQTSTMPSIANFVTSDHLEQFHEEGYTLFKNVFSPKEISALKERFDEWLRFGEILGRTWRRQNTIIWVRHDGDLNIVKGMQWPSYHDEVMNKIRLDHKLFHIVQQILGDNVKQIINQMHWRKPGFDQNTWPLHRDVRSRQPVSAFTNLFSSWVQTGIAVDPHTVENGAMSVVPGSHKDHEPDQNNKSLYNCTEYENDPRIKPLLMDPGDVAIWNAFTVHGGGINTTKHLDRRLYINGFVKSAECTRGELAWTNGLAMPLPKEPALVQFDQVNEQTKSFFAGEQATYD